MLIMNISTPQQNIGVRVSLPLESHHVDGNSFAHKTNVVGKKTKDEGGGNPCASDWKMHRSEKPQQNPSWDCNVDYEYLYSTTKHWSSGISPAGITSYQKSSRSLQKWRRGMQVGDETSKGFQLLTIKIM